MPPTDAMKRKMIKSSLAFRAPHRIWRNVKPTTYTFNTEKSENTVECC